MFPMTSLFLAALFGLFCALLTIRVIVGRVQFKIDVGDGGNVEMTRRIRAQANFTEQVPLALLMFALADLGGAPRLPLYALAALLVVARCLSAYGLSTSTAQSPGRQSGAGLTMLYLGLMALLLLYTLFTH